MTRPRVLLYNLFDPILSYTGRKRIPFIYNYFTDTVLEKRFEPLDLLFVIITREYVYKRERY